MTPINSKPTSFVIMPIKKEGTDDYRHFKSLYEGIIKADLESLGFHVVRSDDVNKSGNIVKDIVVHIAGDDLIVADLTDLNPNVLYELGARHALRGSGTIMILDNKRTPDIPFDLSAYRVIQFTGDLEGVGPLRAQIKKYAEQLLSAPHTDSPIHDWLSLQANAVDRRAGSEETLLRSTVAELQERLASYSARFGTLTESTTKTDDPLTVISNAKVEAQSANFPTAVIQLAMKASIDLNAEEFLDAVERSFRSETFPLTPTQFFNLTFMAQRFESSVITNAILAFACSKYPTDERLRKLQLATFAQSEKAEDRARARSEIQDLLGIKITKDAVSLSDVMVRNLDLFGFMLDAYVSDNMLQEALRLSAAAAQKFPLESTILRNHAKHLNLAGQDGESLSFYRKAVMNNPSDDMAYVWYANALHNKYRHVDSLEAFICACLQDPDDASHFAHVADEIVFSLERRDIVGGGPAERMLPETITADDALYAIRCSLSCESVSSASREYSDRAFKKIRSRIPNSILGFESDVSVDYQERFDWAAKLHAVLRSETTSQASAEE